MAFFTAVYVKKTGLFPIHNLRIRKSNFINSMDLLLWGLRPPVSIRNHAFEDLNVLLFGNYIWKTIPVHFTGPTSYLRIKWHMGKKCEIQLSKNTFVSLCGYSLTSYKFQSLFVTCIWTQGYNTVKCTMMKWMTINKNNNEHHVILSQIESNEYVCDVSIGNWGRLKGVKENSIAVTLLMIFVWQQGT